MNECVCARARECDVMVEQECWSSSAMMVEQRVFGWLSKSDDGARVLSNLFISRLESSLDDGPNQEFR